MFSENISTVTWSFEHGLVRRNCAQQAAMPCGDPWNGAVKAAKMMVARMLGEIRWDWGSESEGNNEKDSRVEQAGQPESLSYTQAESPDSQADVQSPYSPATCRQVAVFPAGWRLHGPGGLADLAFVHPDRLLR